VSSGGAASSGAPGFSGRTSRATSAQVAGDEIQLAHEHYARALDLDHGLDLLAEQAVQSSRSAAGPSAGAGRSAGARRWTDRTGLRDRNHRRGRSRLGSRALTTIASWFRGLCTKKTMSDRPASSPSLL
jgi:hypothetical protein